MSRTIRYFDGKFKHRGTEFTEGVSRYRRIANYFGTISHFLGSPRIPREVNWLDHAQRVNKQTK